MDIDLKSKVDIFKECYVDVSKSLRFDNNKVKVLESFLYITTNEEIDYRKIKQIRKYIKKKEIGFVFNRDIKKVISIFLSSNSNYEKIIKDTVIIYDHLIGKGFEKDKFTEFISFSISLRFPEKEYDDIIKRMIYIKEKVDSKSQIKNGSNLRSLCFLNLSIFTRECDEILKDYFEIYDVLINEGFNNSEAFYSISALILSDNKIYTNRLEKLIGLRRSFKNNNIDICDEQYLLFGLSSLIIERTEKFVDNFIEVYKNLSEKKCLKKNSLSILSIALVLNQYIEVISDEHKNFLIEREMNILNRLIEYTSVLLI